MGLKFAIVVVFILLVLALLSGGFFLFKDQGAPDKRRILWSLGIRVSLAVLLLALVTYGMLSGQLRSKAPWSQPPAPTTPENPASTPPTTPPLQP